MAGLNVQSTSESLLNPELFQLNFAAFLCFVLEFYGLIGFIFYGSSGATMLKFDLRTHGPAFTEVVSEIDNSVRNVETPMTWVFLVRTWRRITIAVVTVVHA